MNESRKTSDPITSETMQVVVAEVQDFEAMIRPHTDAWTVSSIEHYYALGEVYGVRYTNGMLVIFARDQFTSKLRPALTWTFWAEEQFIDTHEESVQ